MKNLSQLWKLIQWIAAYILMFLGCATAVDKGLLMLVGGSFVMIFLWLQDIEARLKDIQSKKDN